MLRRTAALARRQRTARHVAVHRARRRAGLAVLHPIVDVAKLADVMVFVKLLPETDRNNLVKITAALQKAIAEWSEV